MKETSSMTQQTSVDYRTPKRIESNNQAFLVQYLETKEAIINAVTAQYGIHSPVNHLTTLKDIFVFALFDENKDLKDGVLFTVEWFQSSSGANKGLTVQLILYGNSTILATEHHAAFLRDSVHILFGIDSKDIYRVVCNIYNPEK